MRKLLIHFGKTKNIYNLCSCPKVCDDLHYLFEKIYKKKIRQNVRIQMGTNCAPLVADMFCLFCSEIEFMLSFSDNN